MSSMMDLFARVSLSAVKLREKQPVLTIGEIMRAVYLSLFVLALGVPTLAAQEMDELAGVRARIQSYVEAFNAADASALAEHWADDATYINRSDNKRVEGRDAIKEAFDSYFADAENPRLVVQTTGLKQITDTVAIEDGSAKVFTTNQPVEVTNYTAVHVLKDGKWYLQSVRETGPVAKKSNFEKLQDLAWMIGTWTDNSDPENSVVTCKCAWTANQNFMTRSFEVRSGGTVELQVTQVIGWDASEQRIRSWLFDSNGTFGEGAWSKDGNRWKVRVKQTLSDGSKAASLNSIEQTSESTFSWHSRSREVDGELMPNIGPLHFTKVK